MAYRAATGTRADTLRIALAATLLTVLALLPLAAPRPLIQDLFALLTLAALAQFWNLLAGYAGLVSVGQQAFVGVGGYALFAAVIYGGANPLLAVPLAGLAAGLVAFPAGFLVFRLRGAYFAVGTWVVAEVCRLSLAQVKALGGGTGTSLPIAATRDLFGAELLADLLEVRPAAARDIIAYWAALALAAASIAAIYWLLRSRHGLALSAIRDSELAAKSVGVDVQRIRRLVYLATAAGTGMVGGLIYLEKARISPDAAFSVIDWTAYVIVIVVIGGLGTLEGPLVGALVFYALQDRLADFGAWYLMLLGVLAIVVMLIAPGGLWGVFAARTGVSALPLRRRLVKQPTD
jgi:branched-chain amino acid transport system permease protein